MRRGPITGRKADRCGICQHMRRFHKQHVGLPVGVCSQCTINPPYMHNFDEPPRSQDEIEEKKYEQLLNEPPHLLARNDPGDVCMCGDRRIEHGEPPNDGPCRLNGLGHGGAPACTAFRRLADFETAARS